MVQHGNGQQCRGQLDAFTLDNSLQKELHD